MSEVDFCAKLRAWAESLGFEVYPEVAGWDLVLVAEERVQIGVVEVQPGQQVGIHAKLRANCEVLMQAIPGDFTSSGPAWPFVAAPEAGQAFCFVARRLGIGVITAGDPRSRLDRRLARQREELGEEAGPAVRETPRFIDRVPLTLPPIASRAIVAGRPSPRVLSKWRTNALRFLAFARARDTVLARDLVDHGLSKAWVESWLVPVDWTWTLNRRGTKVRVRTYRLTNNTERLPDWGYRDVYDELVAAGAMAAVQATTSAVQETLPEPA